MKRLSIVFTFLLCVIFPLMGQDEPNDSGWYRTQTGTGVGNCGPACVAMSVLWATEYQVTVERVREYIGYTRGNGATDFMELASAMRYWNAGYNIEIVSSLGGLKDLVDRQDLIAIVLIDTALIDYDPSSIFGRNYSVDDWTTTGHYIILTEVVSSYFVVQDPMPNGHDRRYHTEEVWNSLKDHRVILVRNYDQ